MSGFEKISRHFDYLVRYINRTAKNSDGIAIQNKIEERGNLL